MGFELDSAALAIDVIVEVYWVNWAQLDFGKAEICGGKRAVVVVHEGLRFHFSNLVIDSINCALSTTIAHNLFVLCQVFKGLHVVIVIRTPVSERRNQINYRPSLLFWVYVSCASLCRVKYLSVLFYTFHLSFENVYRRDRTLAFIRETVSTTWY